MRNFSKPGALLITNNDTKYTKEQVIDLIDKYVKDQNKEAIIKWLENQPITH